MNINSEYHSKSEQPIDPKNFTIQGDWLCLAQYGNYPHNSFIQSVSFDSAIKIVKDFKENKVLIPLYIGHPDDPQFSKNPGHQDTTTYAIITDLEARDDGLYFKAFWNPQNIDCIKNASLKFVSPRWVCNHQSSSQDNEIYEPVELVSIGLTNDPNLPLDAIPNEFFEKLIHSLETNTLTESNSFDVIIDSLLSAAQLPKESSPSAIVDFFIELINQTEIFRETNNRLSQQLIVLENEVECNRKLFLATQEKLHVTEDLLKQEKALHYNPQLSTFSKTANLKPHDTVGNAKDYFIDCVYEHMRQTGQSFAQSWIAVKQKFPHAFTAMKEEGFSTLT